MKLIARCSACTEKRGLTEDSILWVEIEDGAYYETTCLQGHRRAFTLTTHKFEVLFEFGAMALIDGYPREAVSSFAVALERFHEYMVKALLLHAGTTPEQLEAAWKQVSAQSERQLGAFAILYLREYGTPAPLLSPSMAEFRNNVIHKGYIPSRSEAVEYGDAVLQHLATLYKALYRSRYSGISKLDGIKLGEAASRAGDLQNVSTVGIATVFSNAASEAGTTLEKALGELSGRMERIYKR